MHSCLRSSSSCAVSLTRDRYESVTPSVYCLRRQTRCQAVAAAAAAAAPGAQAAWAGAALGTAVSGATAAAAAAATASNTVIAAAVASETWVHASLQDAGPNSSSSNSNSRSSSMRCVTRVTRKQLQHKHITPRARSSSSSSRRAPSNPLQPLVEDTIAAADAAAAVRDHVQQQYTHSPPSVSSSGSSSSDSDSEAEDLALLLTSAADKLYKQRLRELHALMSPEGLQQLQLTEQQYDSLQVVLSDLQDLQSSWEEDGDEWEQHQEQQLTAAEAAVVEQLTNGTPLMPDDFGSYLMAFLPEGAGPEDVQQLMTMLNPDVLADIQGVYQDLKEFEQSEMDLPEAQERYMQLSCKITGVADRVQSILESYNSSSGSSSSSSSSSVQALTPARAGSLSPATQQDQHRLVSSSSSGINVGGVQGSSSRGSAERAAAVGADTATGSSSSTTTTISSSSSSNKGGRSWGASWGKKSRQGQPGMQSASSSSSSEGVQHVQQVQQQQQNVDSHIQQQPMLLHTDQQRQQQQQQQQQAGNNGSSGSSTSSGDRVRRRRSVIRRPASTTGAV